MPCYNRRIYPPAARGAKRGTMRRLSIGLLWALVVLAGCGQPDAASRPRRAAQEATDTPAPSTPETTPEATIDPQILPDTPNPLEPYVTLAPYPLPGTETVPALGASSTPSATPEPSGPLLREVWPKAPAGTPPVTHLWLRTAETDQSDGDDVLWKIDLGTLHKEQIGVLGRSWFNVLNGQRAPDGQQIAYEAGKFGDLFLWPSGDGDVWKRKRISWKEQNFRPPNQFSYHWVSDGRRLVYLNAFQHDSVYIEQLVIQDMQTLAPARVLLEAQGSIEPLGWLDSSHLLVLRYDRQLAATHLLSLEIEQGMITLLADFGASNVSTPNLAPNAQWLLLYLNNDSTLLDLRTFQFAPVERFAPGGFWSADSTRVLVNPTSSEEHPYRMRVVDLLHPEASQSLTLAPPNQHPHQFHVTNISPDGRFLLGCVSADSPDNTWLYDVEQDRWSLLDQNRSCATAIDWEHVP